MVNKTSLFLLLIFILSLLVACADERTQKKADFLSKETEDIKYLQNDSIEILRFGQHRNELTLQLLFNKKISYDNYFQDLEKAFSKARANKIHLDSIKTISMDFYPHFEELAIEFSEIPGIQEELISQKKEGRPFLNHRLIGKEMIGSKSILKILSLLDMDSNNIKNIMAGKCRSEQLKEQNINSQTLYKLHCFHLHLFLK